jgi:excisionase family DNA binding protein
MTSARGPLLRAGLLLTVEQAAEYMNTSVRFVRRLVAERRIAFVKLGRHVRLSTVDLDAFVAAGRVEPVSLGRRSA